MKYFSIRKLYHPDTLKWCIETWILHYNFKITGFWFGKGE